MFHFCRTFKTSRHEVGITFSGAGWRGVPVYQEPMPVKRLLISKQGPWLVPESMKQEAKCFLIPATHWVKKCAISTWAWVLTFIPWPIFLMNGKDKHLSRRWSWSWNNIIEALWPRWYPSSYCSQGCGLRLNVAPFADEILANIHATSTVSLISPTQTSHHHPPCFNECPPPARNPKHSDGAPWINVNSNLFLYFWDLYALTTSSIVQPRRTQHILPGMVIIYVNYIQY